LHNNLQDCSVYDVLEYLDGTCIRVYFHNNEWRVATKGHTDANRTKWSSEKSFGTLFQEVLQGYSGFSYDLLQRENTYVFLLQHSDNKIVCPVLENKIVLSEVYDNQTLVRVEPSPELVACFGGLRKIAISNTRELQVFLEVAEISQKGVYFRHKTNNSRFYVVCKKYHEREQLKGNTLDMKKQYCELRHANNHHQFTTQFPEYAPMVSELEQQIQNYVRHIHNLYMSKHVRKETVECNPIEKKFLYTIHGFYLRTRQKMTTKLVENLLFCVNPQFALDNTN